MDNENKGFSFHTNGEHRMVFGEKVLGLKDSVDLNIGNATMEGLENFVRSRQAYITGRKDETHMLLNTRASSVTLVIGEHGQRKLVGENNTTPTISIKAKSHLSDEYKEVLEVMHVDGHESPRELAEFLRQRPYLFASVDECVRVVKALKNTSLKIGRIKKDTESDGGEREKQLKTTIEDGQIDLGWTFTIPIFEGTGNETIPVRARFEVNEDLTDVNVIVLDDTGEGLRNKRKNLEKQLMQDCIKNVEAILGQDAIPMVFIDRKEGDQ